MNVIWVVEARAGAYDEYRNWPVHAYEDEEVAKVHAEKANIRAQELETEYLSLTTPEERYQACETFKNEHDPDTEFSGSGDNKAEYYHYAIPFTSK